MRRVAFVLSCILFATGAVAVCAQTVSSATAHKVSLTAGGTASIFQPDFAGDWTCVGHLCKTEGSGTWYPVAKSSNQPLLGLGAYVDVKFSRWVQIEAEGRWLRFNQYDGIHQDNYLIGPRVPVYHFWRSSVYAKTLVGFSKMTVAPGDPGTFTDIAFGGGMDIKMTKRLSLRLPDLEYHYWPTWGNSTLSPYGASVGIGYKIF
jgi:hypothetical protein